MGLDIGTSGVRAAELTHGRSGVALERFGQVALPPGAVRDGEVVDVDAVAGALEHLWASARLRSRKVVLGVANQKVIVRQVELPWLPLAELRSSLAFSVQDHIPLPVDQAILDVHPLEEFVSEGGQRMVRVLLVAAARDMVDGLLRAVQAARLEPVAVDLTPFAVLRSLVASSSGLASLEAEALIDVGARVTNIVVHQGGVPRFVRILLMGGADITDAVAERLGVPLDEAEQLKQEVGLAPVGGALVPHPAAHVVEAAGGAFVEEVRGSLDYYLAQPGAARIGRVVLSGGASRLGGLAGRLAAVTRLPVEPGQPLAGLRTAKTGLTDEQLSYVAPAAAVPVGLALGRAS